MEPDNYLLKEMKMPNQRHRKLRQAVIEPDSVRSRIYSPIADITHDLREELMKRLVSHKPALFETPLVFRQMRGIISPLPYLRVRQVIYTPTESGILMVENSNVTY